ncbi:acyltransferase [Lacticaseibacillus yichunensis]|uniref:Acyltransferase n=3 Tax=Bacilli TaxID=91061 RepID=A0ABW4CSX6_9LACO|nr:acyltransferase family protein [Lacticaseibacillus yichunensis]
MGKKTRVGYFDLLRLIGCLLVVATHVTSKYMDLGIGTANWAVMNAINGFTRAAVVLFIMISGALFLDPARTIEPRKLLRHNVLHLALTLVLWNVLYAAMELVLTRNLATVRETLVLGPFHLWFLYVLLGCYLLVPVLRPLTKQPHVVNWLLALAFIFVVLPSTVVPLLPANSLLQRFFAEFHLGGVGQLWFYFLLGHALHHAHFSRRQSATVIGLGLLATIGIVVGTAALSLPAHHLDQAFQANAGLLVLLQACGLFVLGKQVYDRQPSRFVALFADLALPIYLVHPVFLGLVLKLGWIKPTLLSFVGCYLVIFAAAFVFALGYRVFDNWLRRVTLPAKRSVA